MKHFILICGSILFLLFSAPLLACDVCQDQQPKILRNITHGAGPQGQIDYFIITSAVIIVSLTLIFSIKYLMKPGEKTPGHVKNNVIDNY